MTCASLGFALGPVAAITASVNLGLNLEAFVVEEEAPPPLAATLGPEESGTRLSVSSGCRDIVAGGEGLLTSLELLLSLLPGRKRRWFWCGGGEMKKSLMEYRTRRRVSDWVC